MNTNAQSVKASAGSRTRAKQATVSMTTRALQRLFPEPDSMAFGPSTSLRRGTVHTGEVPVDPSPAMLTPLAHLRQALDSLPHGRDALPQLHAVERELMRGGQSLADLGPVAIGSALCQLGLLQCRRYSVELDALKAALEQATSDARGQRRRATVRGAAGQPQ